MPDLLGKRSAANSSNSNVGNLRVDCTGAWLEPKTQKLTHRRTPSAGSLGCGHIHSPATPTAVSRTSASQPVSPICFAPSVPSKPTNTLEVPLRQELTVLVDRASNPDSNSGSVSAGPLRKNVASPIPELLLKARSKSVDNRSSSTVFITIPRAF